MSGMTSSAQPTRSSNGSDPLRTSAVHSDAQFAHVSSRMRRRLW